MSEASEATGTGGPKAEKEFTDTRGRRWTVRYAEGGQVRGLVSMDQIVFRRAGDSARPEERYLTVHPGFLERAEDEQLRVALSQAQTVDPPW